MFFFLKRFVRRSPFIYSGIFYLKKVLSNRYIAKISSKTVNLCIEGYQSSGNTFLVDLIRQLNSSISVSAFIHTSANIKIALRLGIPTIIIIRHPSDAISSKILKTGMKQRLAIIEYVDFYETVLKNIDRLTIISFDDLTQRTYETMKKISADTKIELAFEKIEIVKLGYMKYLKRRAESCSDEELKRTGIPSLKREKWKDDIKIQIKKSKEWRNAINIFRQIERTVN